MLDATQLKKTEQMLENYIVTFAYDDNYCQLIRDKKWKEAQVILETALENDPQSVVAKLCWVLCQLELRSIPVTALSASLDELIVTVKEKPELHSIAFAVYLKSIIELVRREHFKLATVLFDHLRQLASVVKAEDGAYDLWRFHIGVMKEEITRAEHRREDKAYLQGLKEKLSLLEKENIRPLKASVIKEAKIEKKDNKQIVNSRSLLKKYQEEQVQIAPDEMEEGSDVVTVVAPEKELYGGRLIYKRRHKWLSGGVIASFVLLIIAIDSSFFNFFATNHDPEELRKRLVMEPKVSSILNIYLPELSSSPEHEKQISALANMAFRKIQDRIGKVPEGSSVPEIASSSTSGAASSASAASSSAARSESGAKQRQKIIEGVNDSSRRAVLLEIQDDMQKQTQRMERLSSSAPEEDKRNREEMPRLRVEDIKETKIESLDTKDGRPIKVTTDGLVQSGDGRVFSKNPPLETAPAGTLPNGAVVQGYTVEEFKQPQKYKMVTNANVLSSPSSISYVVGKIREGDTVHVGAKLGPWLEIISERGKKGYVYAQDARHLGPAD
ncbi:MAG: SH3 domain-containing protein [Deltaproteobacteria bacterium]|nr:SH3 domain-containing protein [Deltaproteobacteria bacterium]